MIVTADSLLMIKQMRGEFKIKDPNLKILAGLAKDLSKNLLCSYGHVLRAFNAKADELANQGIDLDRRPPQEFVKYLADNGIILNLG